MHFWFLFGKYKYGETFITNPDFENLTDKINAKEVIHHYISDPLSALYYPTNRFDVYATYSELDFHEIVKIFSFDENEIDFLCKRLIEIDYLRLKEKFRRESLYPIFVVFTNILFFGSILLIIAAITKYNYTRN